MAEIAQLTFNSAETFYQIMDMLDKRLNDKGKKLETCFEGLESNLYIIKTLREFQYIDEDGRDVGQNVRVSAKELTSLILDEERLRAERADRKNWNRDDTVHTEPQRADEEDAEYRLAIEASKYQEEEDRKKRESRQGGGEPGDDDLAKALKAYCTAYWFQPRISATRSRRLVRKSYRFANATYRIFESLHKFSKLTNLPATRTLDIKMDFPRSQTGFDPYASQQQQSFQPQPTGFNPYNQFQQQPQQQQQQQQPETLVPTGTNNPWATNQSQPLQSLQPMPTGSNNPFATSLARPQTSSAASKPTLATLQEQKTLGQYNNTPSFSNTPSYNPITSFSPPPPQKEVSEHEAKLNALLSSGDGMDTFGNTGNLRIPAQHTAPGTFVNSAGAGLGRIHEQQTGNNPFLQTQYTAVPFGRQVPAATGPAGMNGGANGFGQSSNPFGPRPQQGQNGQGGDLIQF
ncbi:hypothetical protein DID88_008456 [Monilinia fructigena]|nr:hypothetical protein DID88_008456 [Monilinia fructigena]